jgi:thymidylate kinase
VVSRRLKLPVLGELFRKCIFPEEHGLTVDNHPTARMLLFAADAVNVARQEVLPALQAGKTVICNRSFYSTFVYQHYIDGDREDYVLQTTRYFLDALEGYTDNAVTIFLDCPPEVAFERITSRNSARNRYDNVSSLQQVREGYLKALDYFSDFRYGVVDATKSPMQVALDALDVVFANVELPKIPPCAHQTYWAHLPDTAGQG